MNNEIKEILDNPKILMLSYGNYILLNDYVKLKDCITNLYKENKRLKNRVKELKYFNDILENKEIELLKENHELKETIEELHKISNLEMKNFIM